MKNKICLTGALLLMLAFSSCREDSDTLIPYDHDDVMAFEAAYKSYASQYKIFWNGMNQNYALWDYEMENGLDWDAEYDKFLPRFEALDNEKEVTDDALKALMDEMVTPLHDGHMRVQFWNYHTSKYVEVSPSVLRVSQRPDYADPNALYSKKEKLAALSNIKRDDVLDYYCSSTTLSSLLSHLFANGITTKWVNGEIDRLSNLTTPTEMEVNKLAGLRNFNKDVKTIFDYPVNQLVPAYNSLVVKYAYLSIPGLKEIDPSYVNYGVSVSYALLKGNIVYMYLSSFMLSRYLVPEYLQQMNLSEQGQQQAKTVRLAWQKWFDKIQELHKAGTLGGVIIDIRGNNGGMVPDYQFVLGALLPSGGFAPCQLRYKRGTARLDYSPLMPQVMPTYKEEHAVVSEPIVVLADCNSISMAEITARSCSLIPNAHLVGKRTWGALCALNSNSTFSTNYSGHIGVKDVTPVYVYTPLVSTFSMDGKQLEGIGIDPEIEVDLDKELFDNNGGDTQLERALQLIRNGN